MQSSISTTPPMVPTIESSIDTANQGYTKSKKRNTNSAHRCSANSILIGFATLALVALSMFDRQVVQGQINWNGNAGFWDEGTIWTGGVVPGATDLARFNQNLTRTISWDGVTGNRTIGSLDILQGNITFQNQVSTQYSLTLNDTFNALEVRGANASFTLSGLHLNAVNGYAWIDDGATMTMNGANPAGTRMTNGSNIFVGYNTNSGSSTLNVNSGADLTTNGGYVGFFSGSTGTINVTGSGSTWANSNSLRLGENAGSTGNLNVNAGDVTAASINVGIGGTGNIVVNNGGRISSSGLTTVNTGSRIDVDTGALVVSTSGGTPSGYMTTGLNVNGGTVDATVAVAIGAAGESGTVNLTNNAILNALSVNVGEGTGILNVQSGSDVNSVGGPAIGFFSGSNGTATITGSGSTWNNTGNMFIGGSGTGQLTVASGGLVKNTGLTTVGSNGRIDVDTGFLIVTTNSGNSQGFLTNGLTVNSGTVDSTVGVSVGQLSGQSGTATFTNNSLLNSNNFLIVGEFGTGVLNVESGSDVNNTGYATLGDFSGSNGTATVTGSGSTWNNLGPVTIGGNGTGQLTVASSGLVKNTGLTTVGTSGRIDVDTGFLIVTTNSSNTVGFLTNGLTVNGGTLDSTVAVSVGQVSGQSGTATFTNNAILNNNSFLNVGESGTGVLNVQSGSDVNSTGIATLGVFSGSNGTATVNGSGSTWNLTGALSVGGSGTGTLNVQSGGLVSNSIGSVGVNAGSTGTVTVTGANSRWTNTGNLAVGGAGTGNLNINSSGLVTVGGTTTIGSDDNVTMGGGRFEFGTTSLASIARIGGSSGSLMGVVQNTSFTNLSSLTPLYSTSLDMSDVTIQNSGTIVGSGIVSAGFTNTSTGKVDALTSSIMRFEGDANINNGQINSAGGLLSMKGNLTNSGTGTITNLGGQIVSEGQFVNQAGGFVSGRGEFTAQNGISNAGTMAFSGNTDLKGDVTTSSGSLILTTGGGTTTFHDDMVHNGVVRTSQGSSTVFLGSASGAGSYTGTGSVYFEGDLRPGNSPAVVSFGGDVIMGANADSHFELGGLGSGMFDQLLIAGDLFLNNSSLNVSLIKGFKLDLSSKNRFLIASVGGTLNGQFAGLGEGARVGDLNLFITYLGFGSGNGIGLFTSDRPRLWTGSSGSGDGSYSAVPEPGSLTLGLVLLMVPAVRRRRNSQ